MNNPSNSIQRNCNHCNSVFLAERATKRYCSDHCRYLAFIQKQGKDTTLNDIANANINPSNAKREYSANVNNPESLKDLIKAIIKEVLIENASTVFSNVKQIQTNANTNGKPLANVKSPDIHIAGQAPNLRQTPATLMPARPSQSGIMLPFKSRYPRFLNEHAKVWKAYQIGDETWDLYTVGKEMSKKLAALLSYILKLSHLRRIKPKRASGVLYTFKEITNCEDFDKLSEKFKTILMIIYNAIQTVVAKITQVNKPVKWILSMQIRIHICCLFCLLCQSVGFLNLEDVGIYIDE